MWGVVSDYSSIFGGVVTVVPVVVVIFNSRNSLAKVIHHSRTSKFFFLTFCPADRMIHCEFQGLSSIPGILCIIYAPGQ